MEAQNIQSKREHRNSCVGGDIFAASGKVAENLFQRKGLGMREITKNRLQKGDRFEVKKKKKKKHWLKTYTSYKNNEK